MASSVLSCSNLRVSSVLNRDSKQFGKRFMLDGSSETCWNSDQGTPQWIHVDFRQEVYPRELHIQFQGGFAGKDCSIEAQAENEIDLIKSNDFYPEDSNSLQIFPIVMNCPVKSLRIIFNNSSDLHGRIIVYRFDIIGDTG